MKTLVLLCALGLLAFQVKADPIQSRDEETKIDEQPGEEDQAVSVSFGDPEGSSLQEESLRDLICSCRTKGCKRMPEWDLQKGSFNVHTLLPLNMDTTEDKTTMSTEATDAGA